jgi:hypothetical protein
MGKTIMLDCQTSSVHMGDNTSAITEVKRISDGLATLGFKVIREKVETVPWHPAAPSDGHANPIMPKDCYFEAHFNIVVNDDTLEPLRKIVEQRNAHLSKNAFKRISDTDYIMMATLRSYAGTYEDFKRECQFFVVVLEKIGGYKVPKTITEFSIYDTNVRHDSDWIGEDS